ncbi:hypothetical protein CH063_11314 [Colletotrichum higginsianum]|uniref:Uncharacterized protein n=1 Tax=Colletotrichum higginsianum (strain IMI 349063) TaxID=759273 RepID=H1VKW0_COLHI|nr:hypothetical protein CH063_11314 [Colletotrichum higginsianum]
MLLSPVTPAGTHRPPGTKAPNSAKPPQSSAHSASTNDEFRLQGSKATNTTAPGCSGPEVVLVPCRDYPTRHIIHAKQA